MKLIEDRNKRNKEKIKNLISDKIKNERQKYSESLDKYIMKKKEEEEQQKEKAFKKYKNFVSK